MSGYDPSNVLSRMRKRREEAQNADNNQRGAYRKTNLQVKVAPSFQNNNNNNNSNNENSTGGQRSPYALNPGLYNNPPPPNQNQLGGGKLSGSGRLTDPRRNRGSASMSGGGGKYTIPSPMGGYKSPEFGGLNSRGYNFGYKNGNNGRLPPLPGDKNNRKRKGGGKANFFAKNRHLTGASAKFQPGGFKGMGKNCRPNGGAWFQSPLSCRLDTGY